MDPMWTHEVRLSHRMLDPLGLSRVSQWMTDQLLPGITTVTSIARNYSFYAWAIADLLDKNKVTHRNQFASNLIKREAAFVIGSILHEQSKQPRLNPHGYDKANNFIDQLDNGKIHVAFNVSESNPEGFYGLYYRTAMFRLGLTIRSRMFDDLTPLGHKLAAAFASNVRGTEYLKHVQDDKIEKAVLSEYGNSACICKLVEPSEERDLLRDIMFSDNLKSLNLERSRRETLLLVLHLIKQSSGFGLDFTTDVFRDAIFFGQVTDGKTVFDLDFEKSEEIVARWHLFQLHEYFTFALESLLHALLNELKKRDNGMTLDDFLRLIGDANSLVSTILKINPVDHIQDITNLILGDYQLDKLTDDSSYEFDKRCNLKKQTSEKTLFNELQEAIESNNLHKIVGNAIAILFLNYIRAAHLPHSLDQVTVWFNNRAVQELSPIYFVQEIRSKINTWTVNDFVRFCFKTVVEQHNLIAYEKLLYGNDTFRLEELGNILKFKRDIYPNYPSQRSSKISSVLSILEQIGLIEIHNNIKRLTSDGERILGDWLNERIS